MADLACAAVDFARKEHGPLRAEELADQIGVSLRSLQRLFREYAGVSPKWVIRRYRLQEAAWHLAQSDDELFPILRRISAISIRRIWRDFVAMLGRSPSDYRERQRA
jgi:transcriptional regulator GlxA family with amidase domain